MSLSSVRCFIFILSIVSVMLSCDKDNGNPVGPGTSDEYGSFVVAVLDGHGSPYEGVLVRIEPDSIGASVELETDADGIARFDSLPEGNYDISSASGRGGDSTPLIDYLKHDVSLKCGEALPVSFTYPAAPVYSELGALIVTVYDIHKDPFEGVVVGLYRNPQEARIEITADENGVARFDSLSPGSYLITFSTGRMEGDKPIIDNQPYPISVSAGETVPITHLYSFDFGATGDFGALLVRVVDEHENPIDAAFEIDVGVYGVRPRYLETNADGIARFDSLIPGEYTVRANFINKDNELPNIHQRVNPVPVSAGQMTTQSFYYPSGPVDVAVECRLITVLPNRNDNIELYFPLWDRYLSLDEQGKGLLTNVSLTSISYQGEVSASRQGLTVDSHFTLLANPDGWPYIDIYYVSNPVLDILTPQKDAVFYDGTVHLTCTGLDFEDGVLPDDALLWSSDIDGELGYGSDITATLNTGRHTITLTGEDSKGGTSTASVVIDVSHFSDQSYFPLPDDGVWQYRYDTPELIVTTETGATEQWTLDGMAVSVEDVTARTCVMDWTIERGGETMSCRYELTDHLMTDGNRFLVAATDERFTVSDGDEVVEKLTVSTDYTPSYPLLADYLDPQVGAHEEITVTAENAMKYTRPDIGSRSWTDTGTFTLSYETGSPEDVATTAGTYATIPYTSTYNGVERTWWLTQGVGIVQMEYDLFGETVTASLYETNMADFAGSAMKQVTNSRNSDPVRIQFDTSGDDAVRVREIMQVMRGMCPR